MLFIVVYERNEIQHFQPFLMRVTHTKRSSSTKAKAAKRIITKKKKKRGKTMREASAGSCDRSAQDDTSIHKQVCITWCETTTPKEK